MFHFFKLYQFFFCIFAFDIIYVLKYGKKQVIIIKGKIFL